MAALVTETNDSQGTAPFSSSSSVLTPADRLRALFASNKCLIVPCCWDGLTARLVKQAGFECTFMSGFSVSASRGFPDCQLVSYEEMRDSATTIASAVPGLVVIGDGDTGYGNCVSIKRTVKGYARAGLAAIMIEDQRAPKRCGHVGGKEVVDRETAFARVRAACDARDELVRSKTGDILILARTDARVMSMDEAIARCQEFRRIGADITFLEAPKSKAEMREYCTLVDGPKMANMLEGGSTPILQHAELEELGFALAVRPITLLSSAIKAMKSALEDLKADVATAPRLLPSFSELKTVVGFDEYFEEEKPYVRFVTKGGGD
jgi:2-methylisocitrate lyase-like PEP mutase family enzyme